MPTKPGAANATAKNSQAKASDATNAMPKSSDAKGTVPKAPKARIVGSSRPAAALPKVSAKAKTKPPPLPKAALKTKRKPPPLPKAALKTKSATKKKATAATLFRAAPKKKAMPAAPSKGTATATKMAPPVETLARLQSIHPDAHCELDHDGPFQLLVATVLSAQTTDVAVNKATPKLFERFPDPRSLAAGAQADVEPYVSTLGFFRQKTKSLIGLAKKLMESHKGEVPRTLAELVLLPGVGRKTANVVLGVVWNTPEGVVVDTHVQRISQRLGWTKNTDPIKIEQDLMRLLPRDDWDKTSHLLIFHGRRICVARKPNCAGCGLNETCPNAFAAENVGRKPKRERGAYA